MKVYTLGYSGWRHAELKELAERLSATIIDVRMVPRSRAPCWNAKAIKTALGDRYVWLDGFGNVNYKNGGPIKLKDFAGAVKKLSEMSLNGPRVILMCGCADVNICHRKIVAEQLAKLWHCEIEHLSRPVRKPAQDGQATLFQE
jgi:uncharacterized protein (DUF488 family)